MIDINSPENILKFADFLFCDKDYLRAAAEYEKYLGFNQNDTVIFKIGLSYSYLGEINNAEITYRRLFTDPIFSDVSKLEIAKLTFFNKRYSDLKILLNDTSYINSSSYPSIKLLNNISILYAENSVQESNINNYLSAFPESGREAMRNFYFNKLHLHSKSPVFAALLSTIIPGSGKIYTGYYGDGITSFILTGVLGYTSYSNFKANHIFRGWLFGSLTGIFYLGNVYGSAVSAQIHNTEANLNFKIDLENFLVKHNYFLPDEKYFCR